MPGKTPNGRLSILLVEDHADTAGALSAFLAGEGHLVSMAASVSEAVKCVVGQKFDLIISDVGLPDGNGVSLMHGIRAFCETPAIALTGFGTDDDAKRCLRAGFSLHLSKPVPPKKLLEAIETALRP